jgi:hypothetical protein
MKIFRFKSVIITFAFIFAALGLAYIPKPAFASYDGGNLIDDHTMLNASTMSANDIQNFLASKGGGLANKTFLFDCAATDASEVYYQNAGAPCGKIVPASTIIYYASQIYGINPQVVLATLQKEQSLITTTDPTDWQINQAMGYACPDHGGCGASDFLYQIDNGTWVLRLNMERARGNMTWWWHQITPWVCGYEHNDNNGINDFYRPNLYPSQNVDFYDQDGVYYRTHYIANAATSSLYCYTPHAYNNPNGEDGLPKYGTTGHYYSGSYLFVTSFERWFGPTNSLATYGYSIVSKEFYSDNTYGTAVSEPLTIEPGQKIYAKITVKNTGDQAWYSDSLHLGTLDPRDRGSVFASDDWLCAGRPATMNDSSVDTGETTTFKFALKAPLDLGTYHESFGVLIEGYRWLDGMFTIPITVASSSSYYSIKTISFDTYSDAAMTNKLDSSNINKYTNSKIYAKAVIKNTGNQTLPAGLTRLAASNPIDRTSPLSDGSWMDGRSRVTTAQEGDILPQGTGTFIFSMTTPNTPLNQTYEQFGLLIESNRWLSYNVGSLSIQTSQRPLSYLGTTIILNVNESLLSNNEKYRLILQGDGNLVLYNEQWKPLWASWTVGKGGIYLVMQADGNLVIYDTNWVAVWNSRTSGKSVSSLNMQDDGNLVIYNAKGYTWASWTVQ